MPTPGDIIVIQKMLVKLGQASVTVTRVGHSTDLKFSEKPPHCHVTVTATDPADSKFSQTGSCDLFGKEPPENANTFIIPVKKGLKLWRKGRTLRVHIVADPNQGFQATYESMTVDLEGVVAGEERRLTVSLKPKNAGGQQTTTRDSPQSVEPSTDDNKRLPPIR